MIQAVAAVAAVAAVTVVAVVVIASIGPLRGAIAGEAAIVGLPLVTSSKITAQGTSKST